MTDDALIEIAKVTDDVLAMLGKVTKAVTSDKAEADAFRGRIIKLVSLTQDLNASNAAQQRTTNNLLMALISELAKAGTVNPTNVAERHLSTMKEQPILFSKHILAQARMLAEQLSHPGFPDAPQPPRGLGPTLIVDNDQPDS